MRNTFIRKEVQGKKYITRPGHFGELQYFQDKKIACAQADTDAKLTHQYRYVVLCDDIYVVCSYSEVWIWFEGQWDLVVYRQENIK